MIRKFQKANIRDENGGINPFAILLHQVEILDEAAEMAVGDNDLGSLLEISERIGAVSDEYIGVVLGLLLGSEDEDNDEEGNGSGKRKKQFGFSVGGDSADED